MDIRYKGKSGIYKITHLRRGIFYIGSAKCIYTRLYNHFYQLKKGTHSNKILQAIYNHYGMDNLKWEVVELCDPTLLIAREQYFIDLTGPQINICRNAQNTEGYRHSEETKKKFSVSRKGNKNSLGIKLSAETKLLISDKAKGRGVNQNLVVAAKKANTGKKHSKEFRNKLAKIQSKVTPEMAIRIKMLIRGGAFKKDVAAIFKISPRLVVRVVDGIGIYGSPDYFEAGNRRFKEQTAQLSIL